MHKLMTRNRKCCPGNSDSTVCPPRNIENVSYQRKRLENRRIQHMAQSLQYEALYLSDRVLVMDNRPSSIRQELAVELAHPRDRRHPLLARLKALSLTELQRAHVI